MSSVFNKFPCLLFCSFPDGGVRARASRLFVEEKIPIKTQDPESDRLLTKSCSENEARGLALKGRKDPLAALEAAACYAFLARQGKSKTEKLADAKEGRKLAEIAVTAFPENATAHYLAAYLAGLEAENDPARGLELVPVIEREALTAAHLNPNMDNGGPDRMLGELYLKAPPSP